MKLIVPFRRQVTSYLCGPLSLLMVSHYFGQNTTLKQLARSSGAKKSIGTSRLRMAMAMRKQGFIVTVKQDAKIQDLLRGIQQGYPVIVNYRDLKDNEGHYGVVVGYDNNHLYLHDSLIGPSVKVEKKRFTRRWFGSNRNVSYHWMMVCRRESKAKL